MSYLSCELVVRGAFFCPRRSENGYNGAYEMKDTEAAQKFPHYLDKKTELSQAGVRSFNEFPVLYDVFSSGRAYEYAFYMFEQF